MNGSTDKHLVVMIVKDDEGFHSALDMEQDIMDDDGNSLLGKIILHNMLCYPEFANAVEQAHTGYRDKTLEVFSNIQITNHRNKDIN